MIFILLLTTNMSTAQISVLRTEQNGNRVDVNLNTTAVQLGFDTVSNAIIEIRTSIGALSDVAVSGAFSDLAGAPTTVTTFTDVSNAGSGIIISTAERSKLTGIAAGAEVNVNADWNATTGDALIANKPTLATVATTGAYSDITGTPTSVTAFSDESNAGSGIIISTAERSKLTGIAAGAEANVNADWNATTGDALIANKPTLATVATTGAYSDITGAPTSVTAFSDVSDAGSGIIMSTAERSKLTGIAAGAEANVNADWNATTGDALIANKPTLATVATTGDYDDLMNIPSNLGLTTQEKSALWQLLENQAAVNPTFGETNCISLNHAGYAYDLMWFDDKCWFAENLRATIYADGSTIPHSTDISTWANEADAYTIYNQDSGGESAIHGHLYNFHAASSANGICPSGWHLPTEAEYATWLDAAGPLVTTLQTQNTEPGDQYFQDRASGAAYNGLFDDLGVGSGYWVTNGSPRYLSVFNDTNNANFVSGSAYLGFSIRCLKDY